VVSAGAKAILDLAKTLELLETLGVPVIGFRTGEFPAFYSVESGLPLEMRAESPEDIAAVFTAQRRLGAPQGLLAANPIPREAEIPRPVMEGYLARAQETLQREGIGGKQVTPFLLAKVLEYSEGRSLKANVALLLNNVRLACAVSRVLALRFPASA
jgi:pseudouridine-5'-phosphate glycosidase